MTAHVLASPAERIARAEYEVQRTWTTPAQPPWNLLCLLDWPYKETLVEAARRDLDAGLTPEPPWAR